MEFEVLGSIGACRDGHELPLGGPKQRALLAMLLLRANEVVSRERLLDGLWGDQRPASAEHTLDGYVSRLRRLLGDGRIERRAPGYVLRVEPGELDVERFERLVARGREELARGGAPAAALTLNEALGLWRGAALADVLYEPFAALEAARLEELRLAAYEERIDADLALGRPSDVIPEFEQLVRHNPFRERLLSQLMLALYRTGRQTEALSVFQASRRRFAEELGLEPGPQLQELQRGILAHDAGLEPPNLSQPIERPRSRPPVRRLAVMGVAVAVAASAAVGFLLGTGGGASTPGLGPTEIPDAPAAMVAAGDSLWSAFPDTGTVSRFDLVSRSVADRVPVGGTPGMLAAGGGAVWVASVLGDRVRRIDPDTGAVTQSVHLEGAGVSALAFGSGSLWVADLVDSSVIEVDPGSGRRIRTLRVHLRPTSVAVAGSRIWVAGYKDAEVEEVDLSTGQTVGTVRVGNGPTSLVVGLGAVWVANSLDSTVSRIDPATDSVAATIPVGSGPTSIALTRSAVLVANRYSSSVSQIDPLRNTVVQTSPLHAGPTAIATARGMLAVGVRPPTEHRGGKLVLLHTRRISIDPALNVDLLPTVSDGLTGDALVTYNHVGGPAGIQLVPDLAVAFPFRPTAARRTRSGCARGSATPTGARCELPTSAVVSSGCSRCIRRSRVVRRHRRRGIVHHSAATSRGIVTDEAARTVTYPAALAGPGLPRNLDGLGLAAPVPPGTPSRDAGLVPIPGTGPYKIASAQRPRDPLRAQPLLPRVVARSPTRRQPRRDRAPLRAEPGPCRARGRAGPRGLVGRQHHGTTATRPAAELPGPPARVLIPTTDFLKLNTTIPPFDDVRVRRALNFALDRGRIARIYGGSALATPTCQILPPGVVGHRRYCPYTRDPSSRGRWTGPDLARAQRLVAASGRRGTPVVVWGWTDDPTISPAVIRYVAAVLRQLGYPTKVRLVPHAYLDAPGNAPAIQLIAASWGDTPLGFFQTWFACAGPNTDGTFCDPRVDAAIKRAQALKATNPRAAADAWAELDRQLVDRAAWAPMINEHALDFVSARVHNYQAHPYWGILADQLWIG